MKASVEQRFWNKVDPCRTDGCAVWLGHIDISGYGRFWDGTSSIPAHHFLKGKPSNGLQADHLCRNRACVWHDHIDHVTPQENWRRGLKGELTTHCPKGHPYSEKNTYVFRGTGHRQCRECWKVYAEERKLKRRLASLVPKQ